MNKQQKNWFGAKDVADFECVNMYGRPCESDVKLLSLSGARERRQTLQIRNHGFGIGRSGLDGKIQF